MIWMFKMNEVFWGDKPEVNEHYLFDTDDVNLDFTRYDISLYFATADYFILSDSNDRDIYRLYYVGTNLNPSRLTLSNDSEYYNIIREYYLNKRRDNKLKEILE